MLDTRGLHGLSCRFSAGWLPRHSALNEIVKQSLQSAGIPSVLEPAGMDRGDGKRPDGVAVFPFARGKSLCWDATCVDTFAETNLLRSPASEAEKAKIRKYSALTNRYRFKPSEVETGGVYDSTTGSVIAEMSRRITEVTGEQRETFWMKQRIGLAIQRGNAHSILAAAVRGYGMI